MEFPSSSSCTTIDLLPPEMLEHILNYVGSNKTDLCNCRLVNSLWNTLAIKIVKPIQLNITFHELVQLYNKHSSRSGQDDDDDEEFNLTKVFKNPPGNFILNLITNTNSSPEETGVVYWHDLFSKEITRSLVGTEKFYPITAIKLTEPMYIGVEPFWNLLKISANSLRELEFGFILIPTAATTGELIRNQSLGSLSFPALKSIVCAWEHSRLQEFNQIYLVALTDLINRAPKLTKLRLHDAYPEQWGVEKQSRLLALIRNISTNNIICNLHELELFFYGEETFNKLCGLRLAQLQILNISQTFNYTLRPEFGLFLATNCPALTSLHVHLVHNYTDQPHFAPPAMNHLPHFPNLNHLSLSYSSNENYGSYLLQNMLYMSQRFEGLRTIQLDLSTCLQLCNPTIMSNYANFTFPSVSTLHIVAERAHRTYMLSGGMTLTNIIRSWCPNLICLVIHQSEANDFQDDSQNQYGNLVLRNILNIQGGVVSLEFKCYFEDWLKELLKCDESTEQLRNNLEQLRLAALPPRKQKTLGNERHNPEGFLSSICNIFPKLNLLEVDEELLRFNGQFYTEQILHDVRLLKIKYPNVMFLIN